MISPAHSSNNDFIQKAATTVSSFSPGGLLLPQQAMEFVQLKIKSSELLQRCNTKMIPTSQWEIDKLGYTGQVLLPDEEDTAFPTDDVSVHTSSKTILNSQRYKAKIAVTYDTIKRQIKGDGLMPYLLGQFSEAAIRDLEDASINGDTSLPATSKRNRLLRKQDGFLKRIVSNVVDAGGARVNLDLLDSMRKLMPSEYYRQKSLEFDVTKNGLIDFESAVAARATDLGDSAFMAQNESSYRKIPVKSLMLMPETLTYGGVASYGNVLFGDVGEQLIVGYLEEMTIRTAEDIDAGKFIAVLRFDVAFQILHEPALVKATNVRN